ncbi:MAG: lytic murein transglycosylase [Xanthobacteraceae bacterium]
MMRRTAANCVGAFLVAIAVALPALAAPCRNDTPFERWLEDFKREAVVQGVSRQVADSALAGVTYDPGVVSRDRGQGVFSQSFLQFAGRMADGYRLGTGAAKLRQHAATLARAEQQFGVPPQVIVALWALETDFGIDNGKLPVLRSLLTLAYDCRRPDMFREELIYALKVVQRGDLTPGEMIGAWAGEIGQTQFSPSAYFKYAVDFDGDGRSDLIHSAPDVIASTANLLAKEGGWKRGQPWLQEVRVPLSLPWEEADLKIKHPRAQWARWGVTLAGGASLPNDDLPASLLLPMGRFGPAFLAYENFNAFREWNQSLVYATTAAYLAIRLAGAGKARGSGNPPTLSAPQVLQLQTLLARQGYDVGKADGKLGLTTRAAVKQAQLKLGMPADSYPTAELIARLGGGAASAAPAEVAPPVQGPRAGGPGPAPGSNRVRNP